MEQAAEQLTDHLVSAIKSQKTFYTLQDLRQNGYPNFVVERIRLAVYDRFLGHFPLADSPWINPNDENLKQSLIAFRQAAFNACVIPQEELYAVTNKVLIGIINVLLRSRTTLAEYIFRGEDVLSYEEMLDRTSRLTVHRHFAQAIPKYMQKRGLSSLTKERCATLIQKLDANLTASYSPQEWAESLELLFTLFGGKVDARLLSIYFEDKNKPSEKDAVARVGGSITKERLIQILSAAEEEVVESTSGMISPGETDTDPTITAAEEEEDDTSLNALFREAGHIKTISDNFEDEEPDSIALQAGDAAEPANPLHKNLASVLDVAAESFRSLASEYDDDEDEDENADKEAHLTDKKQPADTHKQPNPETKSLKEEVFPEEHEEDEHEHEAEHARETQDPLIWQQFLTDEHRDIIHGKSSGVRETGEEIIFLDEDDIIDEVPLFEDAQAAPKKPGKESLNVYLMGQEVFFIEELFNGSEKKYQQALVKIDNFTDWNEASEYIFEHIFATHHIDLSSEAAVDFIDQLQAYFTEYKN